ncbi:MAG: hypothetical protein HYY90_03805 [Candidatus Omnitrophica bacterium]|nr:hypothetical protein [Candidatus Omnitrophota bacterium]MBI3020450.1 hypothetical protein [Candidatus Omnitrophota bacterium]MBI3083467.1 hypothetical protein [Candidatus Omnitrophota bacterium]
MDRRVAGTSLLELVVTVALVGLLAAPLGGMVTEHLHASLTTDDDTAAANLARYEQELFELRDTDSSWCSVPSKELPRSDPDRPRCPKAVKGLNPYVGLPFVVYRINTPQPATDGSSGLQRIKVIVKAIRGQNDTGAITALEPLVTVTTYFAPSVTFGAGEPPLISIP